MFILETVVFPIFHLTFFKLGRLQKGSCRLSLSVLSPNTKTQIQWWWKPCRGKKKDFFSILFLTVKYKWQYHWEQKEQTKPFECIKDNGLSVRIWVITQVSFKNIWMRLITICWLLFCTEMCQQTRSRLICVVSCCVCMCTELVSSSKKCSASTRSLLCCSSQRFWLEMKSQLKHLGHSESSHIHTHTQIIGLLLQCDKILSLNANILMFLFSVSPLNINWVQPKREILELKNTSWQLAGNTEGSGSIPSIFFSFYPNTTT